MDKRLHAARCGAEASAEVLEVVPAGAHVAGDEAAGATGAAVSSMMGDAPAIVFTDVDGTLLDGEHRVREQTAAVVREVVARGVPFVLVSARMPEALYPIQRDLGIERQPLVSYSGAYVLDGAGEELASKPIAIEQALDIKRFLDAELPDVACNTYGFHTWLVDDDRDARIRNEERITTVKASVGDVAAVFGETGIHKFLLMGEPDAILAAERRVAERYPGLAVVRSSDTLCEIMDGSARKSDGVRLLCERMGLDVSRAIAFGDGHNDLDMLRAVPNSWAMANAMPEVKRTAAHVTAYDNDHDGLARTLQQLLG